jgi:hypothetical protein
MQLEIRTYKQRGQITRITKVLSKNIKGMKTLYAKYTTQRVINYFKNL